MPEGTKNQEYRDYIKCVEKPISLETIKVKFSFIFQNKLSTKFYASFDEFIDDMETLFANWIKFRGKGS